MTPTLPVWAWQPAVQGSPPRLPEKEGTGALQGSVPGPGLPPSLPMRTTLFLLTKTLWKTVSPAVCSNQSTHQVLGGDGFIMQWGRAGKVSVLSISVRENHRTELLYSLTLFFYSNYSFPCMWPYVPTKQNKTKLNNVQFKVEVIYCQWICRSFQKNS